MVKVIGRLVDNFEAQLAEKNRIIAELEAEVLLLRGVKKTVAPVLQLVKKGEGR